MLKMVDGTGIIGVDMICPLGVSTPQPLNYDRVELEGTGMLVLPNSLDAPLERLELGGKTAQVTTRGVNLFDASLAKSKENYKDVTINGAIIRAIELDLKPNTKYAFQCVIRSVSTTMNVGNSTIRYVVSDGQKRVITTNEDGKLYVGFTGNVDSEIGKIGVSIVDIQVEEGDTQTAYEPYTGTKPSPSPEYQQKIKNVGKWNEGTQKYEVDVKITNAEQNWSKEQTLTLTSDRPITKWDRLVEQGGQIGWLYKHRVVNDLSALVKDTEPIYGNDGGKYFSVSLQNASLNYDRSKIYSEVGVYGKDNKIHYIPQPMMATAIIHVSDTDTIMTAKEHMHYKVIYETIESQFVPLPQSEQNAIRALKTYYPTTVITADGGELDPDIKVTYRKEI